MHSIQCLSEIKPFRDLNQISVSVLLSFGTAEAQKGLDRFGFVFDRRIFSFQRILALHITMKMDYRGEKRLSIDVLKHKSPGAPIKGIATLGRWSVDRKVIPGCVFRRPKSRT